MSLPQNGAAICPDCGTRVESASTDDMGCSVCLLRVGFDDPSDQGELDAASAAARNQFGTYAIAHHDDGTPWELGRGAMGVTFRAVDRTLNRTVALKIIHSGLAAGAQARERFMRGARVAAALRHPNVATIYHFGIHEETGQFFYAMELVEGETLEERVFRTGPLDAKTTIAIARQVAVALAEAEKRGLVHRDLKPANLMLVLPNEEETPAQGRHEIGDLKVKIIDFGLAKAIAAQGDPMSLTQGEFVGTPAFASPEQFAHQPLDIRSDIYSLGVTLWFALTGKTPFAGRSVNEIRAAQTAGILPLEHLKAARVPRIFESILQSMLAHEPAARPGVTAVSERLRRAEQRMRLARQRIFVMTAAAIILLAGIGYWLGSHAYKAADSTAGAIELKSLAVIPFVDLSREPDSRFFAYGIRSGITSRLSKISQLKVVTSNFNPEGDDTPESVQQLAVSLDVPMLLRGTMKKDGDKFELKVRLTEAVTDREVWSQSYQRLFSGVEEIERDVAAQTAAELGLKLSEPQRRAMANKGTANARAYEAYLKGRYVWLQRTSDAYAQAKEYFEQAIALDPNYANAYAGLGDAYQFLGASWFGLERSAEFYAKAKEALRHALALNPDLAEAHASIGLIAMNYDWDWALADREYKRALSLDPNNALIHDWYAEFERAVGRSEESLHQIEVARQLDPLSPLINSDVGKLLYFARHYEAAIAQLEQTVRMDPNFDQPYSWLGYTYASTGKFDDALREFERMWPEGRSGWQTGLFAYVYGLQGKNAEAARVKQLIKRNIEHGARGDNFALILACIGAGDKDGAFAALESEYADHTTTIAALKLAPYFDSLRSDPRFVDLLQRVGLAPPESSTSSSIAPEKSVLVLPFTNLSRNSDSAYLAEGLRDQIQTRLVKLPELRIISSGPAGASQGNTAELYRRASEAGATRILQGSVQAEGDVFRATIQLVEIKSGNNLWAETYDRKMSDLLQVEKEVAEDVASSLAVRLTDREKQVMDVTTTSNVAAHEAYLKGRYFWNTRRVSGYEQARQYFDRAITLDPAYAQAYAGLAEACQFLASDSGNNRLEFFDQAKAANRKAMELDPGLMEAHASLGLMAMNHDWDWSTAEREFKRAIELNPNYATVRDWYSEYLMAVGRPEESLREMRKARELDPLSLVFKNDLGKMLFFARRYDEAIKNLTEIQKTDPNDDGSHFWLGWAYAAQQKYDQALAEFARMVRDESSGGSFGGLGYVYGMMGKRKEAEQMLAAVIHVTPEDPQPRCWIHIALGEKDKAFACLEEEFKLHATGLISLKTAPHYDSLRSDPRFADLLRRVHLSP